MHKCIKVWKIRAHPLENPKFSLNNLQKAIDIIDTLHQTAWTNFRTQCLRCWCTGATEYFHFASTAETQRSFHYDSLAVLPLFSSSVALHFPFLPPLFILHSPSLHVGTTCMPASFHRLAQKLILCVCVCVTENSYFTQYHTFCLWCKFPFRVRFNSSVAPPQFFRLDTWRWEQIVLFWLTFQDELLQGDPN